jgi:hypothetical protein
MTTVVFNRRHLLAAGGTVLATGVSGLLLPARAQGLAPTESMSGGSNNYRKGAAIVDRIGKGGFWMSGTVRRAGDGAPLAGQRIQRRAGRGGGGPRRGPLDHQSAGHDRRPSLRIADAVLPLRCDRHVGNLRRRALGLTPPAIGTANVAHRAHVPRGGHRRRQRGPRHAGRGADGDDLEGGPLRAGPRGGHKSHG